MCPGESLQGAWSSQQLIYQADGLRILVWIVKVGSHDVCQSNQNNLIVPILGVEDHIIMWSAYDYNIN